MLLIFLLSSLIALSICQLNEILELSSVIQSVAISLDESVIAVSEIKSSDVNSTTFKVTLYERDVDGVSYQMTDEVRPPQLVDAEGFGYSIALSHDGSVLAVGAPHSFDSAANVNSDHLEILSHRGAVFVFDKPTASPSVVWNFLEVLYIPYYIIFDTTDGDKYGSSICIGGHSDAWLIVALAGGTKYAWAHTLTRLPSPELSLAWTYSGLDDEGLVHACAISSNASTIAIAHRPSADHRGQVSILQYDFGDDFFARHKHISHPFPQPPSSASFLNMWFASSIGLSADGTLLAAGSGIPGVAGSAVVFLFSLELASLTFFPTDLLMQSAAYPHSLSLVNAITIENIGDTLVLARSAESSAAQTSADLSIFRPRTMGNLSRSTWDQASLTVSEEGPWHYLRSTAASLFVASGRKIHSFPYSSQEETFLLHNVTLNDDFYSTLSFSDASDSTGVSGGSFALASATFSSSLSINVQLSKINQQSSPQSSSPDIDWLLPVIIGGSACLIISLAVGIAVACCLAGRFSAGKSRRAPSMGARGMNSIRASSRQHSYRRRRTTSANASLRKSSVRALQHQRSGDAYGQLSLATEPESGAHVYSSISILNEPLSGSHYMMGTEYSATSV